MRREIKPASVTVVIPVWDDYVRFLPEAVRSVTEDAPGTPVLLVDNASTTPVPELPGTLSIRSDRRLTAGAIRNLGLAHVDTDYVLVLDADDKLLPGTLAYLTKCVDEDPSLVLCATSIFDAETDQRHRAPRRFVGSFSHWHRAFAFAHCIWSLLPIQGCAIMSTTEARAAGGYADADWGDDWVLAVSLAFRGRVKVSSRLGRWYRATPGSLWRRGRPSPELVRSASLVRERLRSDPAIPRWARILTPLLKVLQLAAIYVVRPPHRAMENLRRRKPVARVKAANVDLAVVKGFGEEWAAFDQADLPARDLRLQFERYFHLFPWDQLPANPVGFDLGCGSGRWAGCVSPRVLTLHCIDPSEAAIEVAQKNLLQHPNCLFHLASVDKIPLPPNSMDFGYSLGVLHHIPDPQGGINACVEKLRPGAPFLLYLYYAFDNRPRWFRGIWRAADVFRRVIARLPLELKLRMTWFIAAFVYLPLAKIAGMLERFSVNVATFPLAFYRDRSFYTMRTDAFDRFGTRIEKRFTKREIQMMMEAAGLERVTFSAEAPYWCALGYMRGRENGSKRERRP